MVIGSTFLPGKPGRSLKKAGGHVSGFRNSRHKTVQQIKKDDYLLCYLTGVSRFVGVLEVVREVFEEDTPIWSDEAFPCRLGVNTVVELTAETAVPVLELKDRLSFFQDMKNPNAWTGRFRGSPSRFKDPDGEAVVAALQEARTNPISRPFDARKLKYRPKAIRAKIGSVTVPEARYENESAGSALDVITHTEVQWLLLKLGSDMGFHVWVAKNDRSREFGGKRFSDLRALKVDLPLQFDEATSGTIQLIDVLWLKGNAIAAAFEIESTTSIYSGLLRMSDLVAMQPNINIPLYLVAPEERREKVLLEVNRPTFSRLSPPLSEICRFISFAGLREQVKQVAPYVRFLKPEFLEELSESCELEEA